MRVIISQSQINEIAEAVTTRIKEQEDEQPARFFEKRLLNLKESGEYIGGKTASAVRNMIHSGIIPASVVKRPSQRRIFLDKIELDKWINAQ